jgi:pantothenate kinase
MAADDLTPLIDENHLLRLMLAADPARRLMLGIAGAPGSGKSTLAERLVQRANAARPGVAALLPMDGYHYDDTLLETLGRKARKGAPDTFDVGGLHHMLERLRARDEAEVAVPVFDRAIEIARAGARLIPQSVGVLVVEGNYLLLSSPPWAGLRRCFDLSVTIETPEATLRERLTRRWQQYNLSPAQIERKLELNDLPNGRRVVAESQTPDYRLVN